MLSQSKRQHLTEVSSSIKIIDNFELKDKHKGMFDLNESIGSNQSAKPLMNEELVNQIESNNILRILRGYYEKRLITC